MHTKFQLFGFRFWSSWFSATGLQFVIALAFPASVSVRCIICKFTTLCHCPYVMFVPCYFHLVTDSLSCYILTSLFYIYCDSGITVIYSMQNNVWHLGILSTQSSYTIPTVIYYTLYIYFILLSFVYNVSEMMTD